MKDRDGNEWRLVPARLTPEMVAAARYLLPSVPAVCMDDAINRAIAAAPQFVAGDVTDEVAKNIGRELWLREKESPPPGPTHSERGRCAIAAVRSELGPALGLVEIREPTPEELKRIAAEYQDRQHFADTCVWRDMFDAVRAVMWPKEGL